MHFIVEFNRKELLTDINFQSVQGLQVRVDDTDSRKLIHYENIILRRAYQPDSNLVKWCMEVINNRKKLPANLIIKLLNADHEMLSGWHIQKAMPVAWGVEELHAQETKILIETIELEYQKFIVLNKNGKDVTLQKPFVQPKLPIKKKS